LPVNADKSLYLEGGHFQGALRKIIDFNWSGSINRIY